MNEQLIERIGAHFRDNFGEDFLTVRAPGRINLIGEHTDYNDGFVLPAAVNHSIYFAVGVSNDTDDCSLISLDFNERYDFKLSELKRLPSGSWQNYILGVIAEIRKNGREVKGFNLIFTGDVPQGSGMSSSAALECGTCFALNELFNLDFTRLEMVKMSQKAEHNYAGVMCGIMDQFASMMGKQDQALKLDCRSLNYDYFPIELNNYSLILCNSNVSHSLASSEYNVRRQQCEEGVSILKRSFPEIHALRDATLEQLQEVRSEMDQKVFLRCKYIIEENRRVVAFTSALTEGNLAEAGEILKIAQAGMADEYEITCAEIDFMADFANSRADILGARMMGGGFGGCTLNLLYKESEKTFIDELKKAYSKRFDKEITPIYITIDDGVELVR